MQSVCDVVTEILHVDGGLDRDVVGDADHAIQSTNGLLGCVMLIVPLNLAGKG
jgi:hypothetical protein